VALGLNMVRLLGLSIRIWSPKFIYQAEALLAVGYLVRRLDVLQWEFNDII